MEKLETKLQVTVEDLDSMEEFAELSAETIQQGVLLLQKALPFLDTIKGLEELVEDVEEFVEAFYVPEEKEICEGVCGACVCEE